MQIERYEETRLPVEVEAQIAALLALAFPDPPGFDGRSFYCQRHHIRLVLKDPKPVAHLAICLREIRLGDRMLRMAGFAEVATHPDRRGEGIAARLVQAGIDEARAMRADLVALFGTAGVYSGAGFNQIPNQIRFVDLQNVQTNNIRHGATENFKILPLTKLDWDDTAVLDLVGGGF